MKYKIVEKWSDWEQYGDKLTDSPFEWSFKAEEGSGYYKFKTKVWDSAGNFVESDAESVSVTLFPTMLVVLIIVLVAILIITSSVVIVKTKKKKE